MTNHIDDPIDINLLKDALAALKKRHERAIEILKILDIPVDNTGASPKVSAVELVNILMDDEKAKALFAKLRNKAFW